MIVVLVHLGDLLVRINAEDQYIRTVVRRIKIELKLLFHSRHKIGYLDGLVGNSLFLVQI